MGTFAGATNNWLNNTSQGLQYQIDNNLYVTDGLVLYLDAANSLSYPGTGTTWTDLSNNNNNGTLVGPSYTTDNQGALVFDGVDDYVNCGSGSSINISGDFSLSAWIYLNSLPSASIVIEKGVYGNSDEYGLVLSSAPSNGMSLQCNNTFFYSNKVFPTNKWTYVVGSLSGTSGKYYEDGVLVQSGTLAPPTQGNNNLYLSYRPSTNYYFNGNIAQVQIYNRALSQAEVQQNFNAFKGRYGL